MRVFVSGAGGFAGSHLCEALRDAGHDVTGMARYCSRDTFGWLDEVEGIRKVRGDVRDPEQMRKFIKGHDTVFHLAALGSVPYSYEGPRQFIETNVTGTLNVLLAAAEHGAKVIHTSTSEVYGTAQYTPMDEHHPINPQSPYAASKAAADALVNSFYLTYGIPCVILRPFNTYGPRQSERAIIADICRKRAQKLPVTLGNAEAVRDFMYVKDTVAAFLAVSKLDRGTFNAATGIGTRIGDLAQTATESDERLRPPASEVQKLVGSADKLKTVTGWRAHVTLETGLMATEGWWRCREDIRKDVAYLT